MRKIFWLSFVVLLCSFAYADQQKTAPARKVVGDLVMEDVPDIPPAVTERMDQYLDVRSASFQDWDPAGKGVLILTRFGETMQVHQVSSPGAARRQLTFLNEPVGAASYPRGKDQNGFLFRMDQGGGEFFQFYWFDLNNGKYRLLTDGGQSVNRNAVWTNSGSRFAFCSTKRNGKDFDIYVMDPLDPSTLRLVKQVEGQWYPLDWSPDDSQLLLQHYVSAVESYLFILNPETGETVPVNPMDDKQKIFYGNALFSRDGKGVYYTSDENSEFKRLTYYDLKSKEKTVLTLTVKWNVESFDLSRDGKSLAFAINEGGISRLYTAPVSEFQRTKIVDLPNGVVEDLKFNPEGTRVGFSMSTAQAPSDVYSLDMESREVTRWTFSEPGGLNPDTFVNPELIKYPTFDNYIKGIVRQIPAFYYKPRDDTKKPFPVLIIVHGGPESQSDSAFSSIVQYLVNELGVAVVEPNVRGSDGYGKTYLDLDNGLNRMDSVKDIVRLLDWIATRPELDSKRVGIYGGSYGGFMALASLAENGARIKCGIDAVGISNMVTFLENTQDYRRDLRRVEYGDERDPKMREFLLSIAPTTNARKIVSPLFVMQGANDPRVPSSEAEQIVKAVRGNDKRVWYMLAKDEGHGFKKKTNRDAFWTAASLFLEDYLLK